MQPNRRPMRRPQGEPAPHLGNNPFRNHLERPQEVPLARPEYTETPLVPPTDSQFPAGQPLQQVQPQVVQPTQQPQVMQPTAGQPGGPNYGFIIDSTPKRANQPAAVSSSMPKRVITVVGGVLLLVIVLGVLKSLLASGPNLTDVVGTVQRQQAILHILQNATEQQGQGTLSDTNESFALTAQLSISSAQQKLITYLTTNHEKIAPKALNLDVSTAIDTQLTNAVTTNTYDATFQQIMQSQLNTYMNDLKKAYAQDTGKTGRALFNNDYDQAKLLLQQLGTPAT